MVLFAVVLFAVVFFAVVFFAVVFFAVVFFAVVFFAVAMVRLILKPRVRVRVSLNPQSRMPLEFHQTRLAAF